jgi:hypothetical protein
MATARALNSCKKHAMSLRRLTRRQKSVEYGFVTAPEANQEKSKTNRFASVWLPLNTLTGPSGVASLTDELNKPPRSRRRVVLRQTCVARRRVRSVRVMMCVEL